MRTSATSKEVIGGALKFVLTTLFVSAIQAQTYNVLLTFHGKNGSTPDASLLRDSGSLYGTTFGGGTSEGCGGQGCGTIFKMERSGQTVLYSFTGGADGSGPIAGVIRDAAGNLYGTASGGGTGFGVVYKLDAAGVLTVLHAFCGKDGEWPHTGVVQDAAGNLYGTTAYGGSSFGGVVYKIDNAGNFSVLYNFVGGTDGVNPQAGLIPDGLGNLYGTTTYGGALGCGIVFQIDSAGKESVLYSFTGGADGKNPYAGLAFDKYGNLYGTTQGGGNLSLNYGFGFGVVYEIRKDLGFSVLYSFNGAGDGAYPESGVIVDENGNVYGTTLAGGNLSCSINATAGCGIVYKLDASGTQTVLHTFGGMSADGGYNQAGLVRDAAGNLYSTSSSGGSSGMGEIFRIKP